MFYDKFVRLCELKGVKPSKAAIDCNIPKSSVSAWKSKAQEGIEVFPKSVALYKIAEYFGVSVDYLLDKEKEPASGELTEKDKKDIARDLEALMEDLESSGDLMFDGDPATPEAVESIRNAMAMALEYAKKVNKEKYTPKKYQKGE